MPIVQRCIFGIVVLPVSFHRLTNASYATIIDIVRVCIFGIVVLPVSYRRLTNANYATLHIWHCGITSEFSQTHQCQLCNVAYLALWYYQ